MISSIFSHMKRWRRSDGAHLCSDTPIGGGLGSGFRVQGSGFRIEVSLNCRFMGDQKGGRWRA